MATASESAFRWKALASSGPIAAHHAGCIIGENMYIHGGIDKKLSTSPLSTLHRLNLSSGAWQRIDSPNAPALSHHACVPLHNRYILLIGGWDGKARISELFAYDVEENRWIFPRSSGFNVGAGLSSHTAALLADGTVLVIGREGSLRMQRRSGNAWILSSDIQKGVFRYSEHGMGVASRSGHTTSIVGTTLYIIGGRADKTLELHGGYRSGIQPPSIMSTLAAKTKSKSSMTKPPCGRKNHVSVSGAGVIFVHGGETFDGRSRDPVGEMYVIQTKPHAQWIKLGSSDFGRAGHVCCASDNKIVIHGGEGARGAIHGNAFQLDL